MSRESELKVQHERGQRDYDRGQYNKPSDNGLNDTLDTLFTPTTSSERDSAYHAGHSQAGRDNK